MQSVAVPLGVMIVIFGSLLAGLALICWTVVRLVKGGGQSNGGMSTPEETQLMQDLYHGLRKMEERVESLETLLLERERKGN